MMKLSRETWILLLTGAAAAAALALGVAAFRLARHEEEFRKEELRSLLKSECRLFADRCRQALDAERRELAELAAGAVPSVAGIREAVGRTAVYRRISGPAGRHAAVSGAGKRLGEAVRGAVCRAGQCARRGEHTVFQRGDAVRFGTALSDADRAETGRPAPDRADGGDPRQFPDGKPHRCAPGSGGGPGSGGCRSRIEAQE